MVPKTWIDWDEKIAAADALAAPCRLCPRSCGVDRIAGERGFCRAGSDMVISSIFPHFGEEPPLTGTHGSGTVFFSGCTLQCAFCQNYQISHQGQGRIWTPAELSERLLWLQEQGCHNVNLVTAGHFLPHILRSLKIASEAGLCLPIVYNCGGYETLDALRILDSVADIYLPDMKYGDNAAAAKYSCAGDYVEVNRAAIREMFRQVGPLKIDTSGIAGRGLCIRHLVLPAGLAGSEAIRQFLLATFDPQDIFVSIMAQYHPVWRAHEFPEINRPLSADDYTPVRESFLDAGFEGFFQEFAAIDDAFLINFKERTHEPLTGA
jgi:putative pyruvate formate lyase activating enzyme